MSSRKHLQRLVILGWLTVIGSVLINIATESLPDFIAPYKWIAWPLLLLVTVATIWFTIILAREEAPQSEPTHLPVVAPYRPTAAIAAAPPPIDSFVGRYAEREQIRAYLTTSDRQNVVVAILGGGGVGKTTLAKQIADELKNIFKGGVFWADLFVSQDIMPILASWAYTCGENADAITDLPTRAARIRDLLATRQKDIGPVLIIIDDIWSNHKSSVQHLLTMARPPSTPALLTLRDSDLASCIADKVLPLDLLSPEQALELFAAKAGNEVAQSDREAARDLMEEVGYLPLAVTIAGTLAKKKAREPSWRLTDLLTGIRVSASQLLNETPASERGLAATFALTYNTLSSRQQCVFRSLAVLAPAPFRAAQVAILLDARRRGRVGQHLYLTWRYGLKLTGNFPFLSVKPWRFQQISDDLLKLEAASLIQFADANGTGTLFNLHPILRLYAVEQLRMAREEDAFLSIHMTYYLSLIKAHSQFSINDFAVLDAELPNILTAMSRAYETGKWRQVVSFVRGLDSPQGPYLSIRGYQNELCKRLNQGIVAADKCRDQNALAVFSGNLATLLKSTGEIEKAHHLYKRVRNMFERMGNSEDVAKADYFLGQLAQEEGKTELAVDYYHKALFRLEKKGLTPLVSPYYRWVLNAARSWGREAVVRSQLQRLGIAERTREKGVYFIVLEALSEIALARGRRDEARSYLQKALDKATQIHALTNISMALRGIGVLEAEDGNIDKARAIYRRVAEISAQLWHEADQVSVEEDLVNLASALDDRDSAQKHLQQCLDLYRRLTDKNSVAYTARRLGSMLSQAGDEDAARQQYEYSIAIYRDIDNKRSQAETLEELGGLARTLVDVRTAESLYLQSAALWRESGDLQHSATTLINLGQRYFHRGALARAKALYEQGLEIYRGLNQHEKITESLLEVGYTAWYMGEPDAAASYLQEGKALVDEHQNIQGAASIVEFLGVQAQVHGDYQAAGEHYEQCLKLFGELGNKQAQASVMVRKADIATISGDYDTAAQLLDCSLKIYEETKDRLGLAIVWTGLVSLNEACNAFDKARQLSEQALGVYQEWDYMDRAAFTLNMLSEIALIRGEVADAEHLYWRGEKLIEIDPHLYSGAVYLLQKGVLAMYKGNLTEAQYVFEQAKETFKVFPAPLEYGVTELRLGVLDQHAGRLAEASGRYVRGRAVFELLGAAPLVALTDIMLGRLAAEWGGD